MDTQDWHRYPYPRRLSGADASMPTSGGTTLSKITSNMLMMTDSEPLTRFHMFRNLPLEIRSKIWNLSMLPRRVTVQVRRMGRVVAFQEELIGLFSTTPVPAILHVC
jgi:2EXR family